MNKAEFLMAMRTERAQWETVLAQVGEARMTRCGVAGDWSVKDVIAHITWFEREMVSVLRARALVGSGLWAPPSDQRNAAICEESRERPLQEVLTEARQVYAQFVTETHHRPKKTSTKPAGSRRCRLTGCPGKFSPAIRTNTTATTAAPCSPGWRRCPGVRRDRYHD